MNMARAFRPVSGESPAAFRVIFGLVGLAVVLRLFAHGWIGELYIEPEHHFSYPGFGWVKPWPGWGMYLHFAALGALSVCIAAGYRYRLCAALFFVGFTYTELIDRTTYLNHHYWICLAALLIIFLPLNRVASVDAWRKHEMKAVSLPTWVIWALRAQVGVVYVFAGIAKLNPDWLLNAQPMRIWLYQHGDMPLLGPLLQEVWAAYAMSWAGAAFDLTIVGWLLWRRTRLWAYLVLVGFHVATWVLFPRLGVFPWMMIGASLVFFNPDWPRRVARAVRWKVGESLSPVEGAGRGEDFTLTPALSLRERGIVERYSWLTTWFTYPCEPIEGEAGTGLSWRTRAILVGLGVFALVQIVLPLRHFAYSSNVRWSEEGYLFSWRVMLTEKAGFVQYRVRDPETRQAWIVSPEEYLTPLQVERMAFQPDLILQTAHIIAEDFAERGFRGVTVNADAFVSWNGRANARLIDPDPDLAAIAPGLGAKDWILPHKSDYPPSPSVSANPTVTPSRLTMSVLKTLCNSLMDRYALCAGSEFLRIVSGSGSLRSSSADSTSSKAARTLWLASSSTPRTSAPIPRSPLSGSFAPM